MKAKQGVVELLNKILTADLTAINQYFVHAKMCDNWGYERLHQKVRQRSFDEMKDAEELIEHILYLEGRSATRRWRRPCPPFSPRAAAARGAPPTSARSSGGVPGWCARSQGKTVAASGSGKSQRWQRLLSVGRSRWGWADTSRNTTPAGGSSNNLSRALAVNTFMASAGSTITTRLPPRWAVTVRAGWSSRTWSMRI